MAAIKNKNGDEFYTNSEYYEKQEADSFIVKALLGSLIVSVLFYSTFYQYFNVTDDITYNLYSFEQYANIATVVTFALSVYFYYRAKNKNIFYTKNVLGLPFFYAFFLGITIFAHSQSLKKYGKEYSFSTYFNNNVVTKDSSDDINFSDKSHRFIEALGK